ncbi:MAG: polysaccharide deacetylase family protein [Planctomycetes bacterium]|nr:polysaccharide deacetylase family protein [Planctomycetota bacterium]
MKSRFFTRCSFGLLHASLMLGPATAAEVARVEVGFVDDSGPATLSVKATDKYELRINIDPQTERKARTLQVELPIAGPNAWPFLDVAVLDSKGHAVSVRRGGIEWHKLLITVPPERSTLLVHAVDPADDRPPFRSEKERHATDPKTGLSATISKWFDGRRAALSIRFDDSHPTHLSKAIPILNEYGFRGTFMVNPGGHLPNSRRRSAFEDHRAEWEAVARRGDHEFANHTMNHHGARDDESMEHEIGDAAKTIWKLFPKKSKLLALNLGGGTQWVTTKTLRYYLDKYHLFDASSNSTGMDDRYGKRIATFRRLLEAHIERGLWYKVHFHYIGDGLSTSEANFRAALDIAKEHQHKLWIAGMADIYKYDTERRGAKLEIENKSQRRIILTLSCTTEPELYDQPLTMDVTLPQSWATERVVVTNHNAKEIDVRKVSTSDGVVLRFDVRPTDAEYTIEKTLPPN